VKGTSSLTYECGGTGSDEAVTFATDIENGMQPLVTGNTTSDCVPVMYGHCQTELRFSMV